MLTQTGLLPLRDAARDVFARGLAVMIVTSFASPEAPPPAALLHGLFDLTPAEARIAAQIGTGSRHANSQKNSASLRKARITIKRVVSNTGALRLFERVAMLTTLVLR